MLGFSLHVFFYVYFLLGSLKFEDDSDLIIELSPVDEVRERRHEHDRHELKPIQKSVSANALTLLIQAPGSYRLRCLFIF